MDTLILSLFGLSAAVVLGVSVARMLRARAQRSDRSAAAHGSGTGLDPRPQPRSERELERDRQTALVWLCALAVVVGMLVLAYLLTR